MISPVVGRAVDVLGRRVTRIEEAPRPLHHVILVVVEYEYLRVRVGFREGRAEAVRDEVPLGLGVVGARVPGSGELRLVLDGHAVEVYAVVGICPRTERIDCE